MQPERFKVGLLIIFLIAGILGVYLSAAPFVQGSQSLVPASASELPSQPGQDAAGNRPSGATYPSSNVIQASAASLPGWQQVNSNGFGDPGADEVTALASFGEYLYAGTHNPIDPGPLYDGAGIFRSPDGTTWTSVILPGFGNTHDTAPPAILDMTVFKSYLYASTGRGNAAQIWRSIDGLNWGRVVNAGFGDPDIVEFTVLAEDNGWLYVGATRQDNEAQIWRTSSGDGNLSNWAQVAAGTEPAQVTGMSAFNVDGGLYAAVQSEAGGPAQVWRSYGGLTWTAAITNGFGISNTVLTGGMAQFGTDLYVGGGNVAAGALLWRTPDGDAWQQVIPPAFGNPDNSQIDMVYVFQNQLYVSTRNAVTGIEIWRSADGTTWEQVNQDGFGDSNNTHSNWSNASASFLGQLYAGTANAADGGELWRTIPPFAVILSPDETQSGSAGQSVTYTVQITNTGAMSDTYDLALSGQTWASHLSTSQVYLTPAASTSFTVTVDIPAGALGNAADTVTVTATSQGDAAKSDNASLTTGVLPEYGLTLSPNQSGEGAVGQNITYTLWITNTGNMSDIYDLALSGQSWTSSLSTSQVSLAPAANKAFTVTVSVPGGALGNATDTVTVTATSQGNAARTDSALLTSTALPHYALTLSPNQSGQSPAGHSITYTLWITNTGNTGDIYDLALSGQTWTSSLSTSQVNLAPATSTHFTVTVDIPGGAPGQASDTVTVTATSQGNPVTYDSAVLTSMVPSDHGLTLSPNQSNQGQAGHSITYTLWITNTGNLSDIYDLALSDQTWTSSLSTSQVSLAPAARTHFTVTVDIPAGALGNATDAVTVTATSQGDAAKSDSAVLMTRALPEYSLKLSPGQSGQGALGQSVTYTLSITNTGNMSDIYDLALSGQTWTTLLSTSHINLAPGASTVFTVSVTIPADAVPHASDAVTITATSQGMPALKDTAILTTKYPGPQQKLYLPFIVRLP